LSFGPAGSGKTTAWLDIAKWSARTGSPARFFVLDTDFSVGRMVGSYPEIHNTLDLSTGYDWKDYELFQKRVLQHATADDWVIVDFVGAAWSAVQESFVQQVFHQDIGNYFLQARKTLSAGAALDGWTDWSVINNMYYQWVRPLLFKGRYHVYATAQTDQLSSDKKPTEDSQTRGLLLPFGVKPKGQKELVYQFHTLLLTGRDPRTGTRTITSIKDRERTEVSGQAVNSFTLDYLKAIAGWELA
jgi:hypothetical protein